MEPSELYHYKNDAVNMNFKVVVTLRASTVERWIRNVKRRYLDAAPMKIVGLDCEFTDAAPEERQRAAVLQLSANIMNNLNTLFIYHLI